MGGNSKSEDEWRAILSPEQVCSQIHTLDICSYVTLRIDDSLEFYARREQRHPTLGTTITMKR
jgi:hypothetical protein